MSRPYLNFRGLALQGSWNAKNRILAAKRRKEGAVGVPLRGTAIVAERLAPRLVARFVPDLGEGHGIFSTGGAGTEGFNRKDRRDRIENQDRGKGGEGKKMEAKK